MFERPFLRSLFLEGLISTEGKLRFKIDWASRIVGSKFNVFALFYFAFEGNFPSTSHRGAYIWRCDFTEGFLRYRFGWLIFGGLIFGFYGMTIIPFDNTTSVTLKMYLRFWRSMAMTRAHAHQVATLLEETPHSYLAFSFPLTSGREHAQYGTKTRGTRLKNGESGKVFSWEKRARNWRQFSYGYLLSIWRVNSSLWESEKETGMPLVGKLESNL